MEYLKNMSKKNYERFWFILSRLAAISIVLIVVLEVFSRYLSDVAIPGLLLGIVIFLVFFAK